MTLSDEDSYLQELMRDFPAQKPVSLAAANSMLDSRYNEIHDNVLLFGTLLDEIFSFHSLSSMQLIFHKKLYQDILGNAGQYRQNNDKGGGVVYFGSNSQFTGSLPENIHAEIEENNALLILNTADPMRNGVQFYQRFVQIHPFYDANGRIGRLIVSIYFAYHNLYVDWDHLKRNGRWLKKLNDCHKRYGRYQYEYYLDYLCSHWRKSMGTFERQEK